MAPAVYRLRVQGHVPAESSEFLMGMNITTAGANAEELTTLVGRLPDQTALAGILMTLHEMRFPILSVERLEVG